MRTRQDVRTLATSETGDWPQALVSYRKAVQQMRALDPSDTSPPTNKQSWQYLAAVHGRPRNGSGDLEDHSDPLWTTCQHGSWFFFPWHRMYLLALEAFVQHFSGDPQWAVPYWYAIDPETTNPDVLPNAFVLRTADGTDNALYIAERSTRANKGLPVADGQILSALTTQYLKNLKIPSFSTPQLQGISFGGGEFSSPQFQNKIAGAIENTPHGAVHNFVGADYDPTTFQPIPPYGFMSDLLTAARDPIFWLHHANIDRLWQMWLDADTAHHNSADTAWLNTTFTFPAPDGGTTSWAVKDVLDIAGLGYAYDTAATPSGPPAPPAPSALPGAPRPAVTPPPPSVPPQVIGAAVDVAMEPGHDTEIELSSPAVRSGAMRPDVEPPRPRQWLLRLEGITGTVAAPMYSVYLDLPAGASPQEHPERLAGSISTFGVRLASLPGGDHDGDGLTFILDITEAHDALVAAGAWNPSRVSVAFVPLVPPAPDDADFAARASASAPAELDLRAGRVAVLVA